MRVSYLLGHLLFVDSLVIDHIPRKEVDCASLPLIKKDPREQSDQPPSHDDLLYVLLLIQSFSGQTVPFEILGFPEASGWATAVIRATTAALTAQAVDKSY